MAIQQQLWLDGNLVNIKNVEEEAHFQGNLPNTQNCTRMEYVALGCAGPGKQTDLWCDYDSQALGMKLD